MLNSTTRLTFFIIFSFFFAFNASANDSDIVNCNRAWKIVVLGSSTSFGTGATVYDSSWVGKFTAYLKRKNSENEVYNLGIPGFSTYENLCPSGFSPPDNRPAANTSFNITAALDIHPDAIIINMPSNDVANGYTVEEQQANFERAAHLADSANIPVWVTTTQPRNNMTSVQVANLTIMRDWINTRFGDKAVDFWTGIANGDGSIVSYYDYDYVHVNNFGHDLLYKRMAAETILDSLCIRTTQTLVARAGNDLTVTLPVTSAVLDGSNSVSSNGGIITSYLWTKISGPASAELASSGTAVTTINNLIEGRYAFSLTVTDNALSTKTDTVNVVVSSRILIEFGPETTASPDAAGNFWNTITDVQPGVKLQNAVTTNNTASTVGLQVVNRIDGTFNTAGPGTNTGNALGALNDYPATATNDFAFAEASAANGSWKITGLEPTKQYTIKFWGTRTVSDDRVIQIKRADQSAWQEYNSSNNNNYNTAASFTFSGKSEMNFDIRVKSGSAFGYICLIDISRTTPAVSVNVPPFARANDVTIPLPATTGSLDGSASADDDGSITNYQWTQTSGPSIAELISPNNAVTAINNLAEGIYTFRLTVTDDSSAVAFTDITVTVNSRVLFDFGGDFTNSPDASGKYWNNVADGLPGIKIQNAINTGNIGTGINLEVINRIDGTFNTVGPGTNTGNTVGDVGDYPASATTDFAFAHNSATDGSWKLTGLDSLKQYTVKFWGTRDAVDDRIIQIKPADDSTWQEYDAKGNTDYNNATVFTFSGKAERIFDIRVKDNNTFGHISLIDIKITNAPVNCTPAVSITSDQVAAGCYGTAINFTATATNGGTLPAYQWKKNGADIDGAIGSTYTSSSLDNNDSITCVITANTNCGSGITATSNIVTAAVLPAVIMGNISGPTDACSFIGTGNTAVYTVAPIANVNTYIWNVSAGASIISGQGTTSITVSFSSSFGSIGAIAVRGGSCSNGTAATLALTKNIPATPGAITGPASACLYFGTTTQATYSVAAVPFATSYVWTVPANVTLVSGQGTNTINVTFSSAFITSAISVKAASNCFTSKEAVLIVSTSLISTPGAISGPIDACPFIGTTSTATYTIRKVTGATAYIWTVPAGTIIASHPGGTGLNDTTITVSYTSSFVPGSAITVQAAGCLLSTPSSLTITRTIPATPGAITGPTEACAYIGTTNTATYTIRKVAGVSSYLWTVPTGTSISSHPAGTGVNDTTIKVAFTSSFVSGSVINVKAVSCAASNASSLAVIKSAAGTPGVISGPTQACAYIGTSNTATYTIRKVTGAVSYIWTVPAGATVSSHPAGAGVNDTIVKVSFTSSFVSGSVIKVQAASCSAGAASSLTILKPAPATPGPITILANPCPILGLSLGLFSIHSVPGATSYTWTAPAGSIVLHATGTGVTDTSLLVIFPFNFSSGTISVKSSNGCGSNNIASTITVRSVNAATISLNLTGPSDPCPYIGATTGATYKVRKIEGVSSYSWSIPSGTTVVHPNGSGVDDTVIVVKFTAAFNSGNISVTANTLCGSSPAKKITLVKALPATPGNITTTSLSSCPNRRYTYSIAALPANATSVTWTVPSGATIISGQGTTNITVSYPTNAVSSTLSVRGKNNCGNSSSAKTLNINLAKCNSSGRRDSNIPGTEITKEMLPTGLEVTVMPNPTYSDFKFIVRSSDQRTPVSLQLTDISGKVIEIRSGIVSGQTISIGTDYKRGIYIGEFIQGEKRNIVKLIKL